MINRVTPFGVQEFVESVLPVPVANPDGLFNYMRAKPLHNLAAPARGGGSGSRLDILG